MKKSLNSVDINLIAREMNQHLKGAYFSKAYQPDKDRVLIRFNIPGSENVSFEVIIGKWIRRFSGKVNTEKISMFVKLVRSRLSNSRVERVEQHEFDRVMIISFKKDKAFNLIIEFFRSGNMILTDDDYKIIAILRPQIWKHRSLLVNEMYSFPPELNNPLNMDYNAFSEIIKNSDRDVIRTLFTRVNIPGVYAENISMYSGINKNVLSGDLDDESIKKLYTAVDKFRNSILSPKPCVMMVDGAPEEISAYPLSTWTDMEIKYFDSFIDATDFFVDNIPINEERDHFLEKLERRKRKQEDIIELYIREEAETKELGDFIYENYSVCDDIIKSVRKAVDMYGWDNVIEKIRHIPIIESCDPADKTVNANVNGRKIKLNIKKSINDNAGFYYEASKSARQKLVGAREALKITENLIQNYSNRKEKEIENKKHAPKEYWFMRYRWFITSSGNICVAGKDAKTNDMIVRKYLKDKDIYVHADIHGAPSVIIKHNNGIVDDISKREAGIFSVIYSRGWNSKVAEGDAYWVLPDQVSKKPPAGEFLAKGSFIINGKRNYMKGLPMRMAVGIIEYMNESYLVSGPENIFSSSSKYIVLVPGKTEKEQMVNELGAIFGEKRERIRAILPAGASDIVFRKGV